MAEREFPLAAKIEHTLLRPDATFSQIKELCKDAREYQIAAVCVNPMMVSTAAAELRGTDIPIAAVANFPLGTSTWKAVNREIEDSIRAGARHIDLVLPLALFLDNKTFELEVELDSIRRLLNSGEILKCIVELSLLPESRWHTAVEIVKNCGADYFKTGTGFFGSVTVETIQKLRDIDQTLPIKAAGGISTHFQALALLAAGANLLGSSKSVEILTNRAG